MSTRDDEIREPDGVFVRLYGKITQTPEIVTIDQGDRRLSFSKRRVSIAFDDDGDYLLVPTHIFADRVRF